MFLRWFHIGHFMANEVIVARTVGGFKILGHLYETSVFFTTYRLLGIRILFKQNVLLHIADHFDQQIK